MSPREGSLAQLLRERWRIMRVILIDTAFLALWLILLRLSDLVANLIDGKGPLEWTTAKALLAVSTLALIGMYICEDLAVTYAELRSVYRRRHRELSECADGKKGGGRGDDSPKPGKG